MKHAQFSKLKSRYNKIKISTDSRKKHIKGQQQLLAVESEQLKEVKTEMDKMNMPTNPVVSHHAIVRYAQRVLKLINPQEITEEILTPEVIKAISEFGDGHHVCRQRGISFKVVVENNVVTTILT